MLNLTPEQFEEITLDLANQISQETLVKYTKLFNIERESGEYLSGLIESSAKSSIKEALGPFLQKS